MTNSNQRTPWVVEERGYLNCSEVTSSVSLYTPAVTSTLLPQSGVRFSSREEYNEKKNDIFNVQSVWQLGVLTMFFGRDCWAYDDHAAAQAFDGNVGEPRGTKSDAAPRVITFDPLGSPLRVQSTFLHNQCLSFG